jgi:hypothetical protein
MFLRRENPESLKSKLGQQLPSARTAPAPQWEWRKGMSGKSIRMVNPSGGLAPPLVILKRDDALSSKEFNNMDTDQFAEMIKRADDALARDDLDSAEYLIDQLMHKARKQSKNVTVDDTWSKAGDDDEEEDGVSKIWYPSDQSVPKPHENMGPVPVAVELQPETYQFDVTPTARAAQPHEFNALVAFVQDRDKVSRTEAQSIARREYPDAYQSYQSFNASTPINEQATRRGNYKVGKSAPITYEELVSQEMRRGCNMETSAGRVMQKWGSAALRHRAINKNVATVEEQFTAKAQQIWENDAGCSRTEALRRARLENPALAKALRSL